MPTPPVSSGGAGFKEPRVSVRKKTGAALSPTGFLNMMLDKVTRRHAEQLNPWLRGVVDSYNQDGTINVTRTGEAGPDEDNYFIVGPPPPVGQDVFLQRINGQKPVVMGGANTTVPAIRLWRSSTQTVTNDVATNIIFDTIVTNNSFGTTPVWTAGDPTKLILPSGGIWAFGGTVRGTGGGTNSARTVQINATYFPGPSVQALCMEAIPYVSGISGGLNLTQTISSMKGGFHPGDYLQLQVLQGATAPLGYASAGYDAFPVLWAYQIST